MRIESQADVSSDEAAKIPPIGCGTVLGQYRLFEIIGKGGFGCVYRARHELMDRIVALKIISPTLIDSDRTRTWFLREVRASTNMLHPNIVTSYDADEMNGVLFLAMEYVDGINLEKFVRKQGPLPVGMALEIAKQTAAALQHAHEKRLVHRDVKPANLLIVHSEDRNDNQETMGPGAKKPILVKLTDFGLARLSENSKFPTIHVNNSNSLVGTPHFIAPEQARDIHDADIRSDLYSLGCTMYFMLAGREPFPGKTAFEIVTQHYEKQATPIESIRSDITPAAAQIVKRLMAKEPGQRIQSPSDLLEELRSAYVGGLSSAFLRRPPTERLSLRSEDEKATVISEAAGNELVSEPDIAQPDGKPKCDADEIHNPTDAGSLRRAWQNWRSVVQQVNAGNSAMISDAEYRSIHNVLAATLRSADPESISLPVRKMTSLIAPWISLSNLTDMDRSMLAELESRCAQLDQEIGAEHPLLSVVKRLGVLVLCIALIACGGWLASDLFFDSQDNIVESTFEYLQTNTVATIAIVVPVAVFGAAFVFGRLFRR